MNCGGTTQTTTTDYFGLTMNLILCLQVANETLLGKITNSDRPHNGERMHRDSLHNSYRMNYILEIP